VSDDAISATAGRGDRGDGTVDVARVGGVVTITIDRPERRNALTPQMVFALIDALEGAAADETSRVVVITGRGEHFCSGADIGGERQSTAGQDGTLPRPRAGHMRTSLHDGPHRLIRTVLELPLPVVAAVRGSAAGLGNALALSADHVVAARSARFWAPFVARGFTPDAATTYLLPRLIGMARAKQMVLRGRPVDGETAAAWGLVAQVVADELLDDALDAIVAEFAGAATVAVGLAKSLLHRNADAELGQALYNEELVEELAIRSDDFKAGIKAFAGRTEPDFRGR
jgi:2-(1,2-epoxy-1,2-dihydrophenyl)acetyl-CoA isomerase